MPHGVVTYIPGHLALHREVIAVQTRLTLRLDAQLVKAAKRYARRTGRSLSQMVAEYFSALPAPEAAAGELPPVVSRLKGSLAGTKVDMDDYRAYLESKHGWKR